MTGLKIIDGTPTAMSKYLREKSNSGMCEFPNSPLTIGKAITYEDLEKALQSQKQKIIEKIEKYKGDYRSLIANDIALKLLKSIGEKEQ